MSRSGVQFDIARSTGVCAATGVPLEPGTTCIATLCERTEDDGFDRHDYSLDAWEAGNRPQRLFSYWKSIVPEPNTKKKVFVDDDLLLNLFERLEDDDRPQRVAFRFVIGLVLMRKKILRYIGRATDGEHSIWQFRMKGQREEDGAIPISVIDPGMSDDDVRGVSDQLTEVLNGDLE